eukprot:g4613.t1
MRSLTHLDVSFNKLGDECLSEILIAAMWSRFFEKKEKSKKKLIPLRVIVKENALNRLHVLEPEVTLTAETAILLQEKIIALKKIDIDTQEMDTAKQEYRFESRIGRKSMLNVHSAEAKARHKEGNVKSGVVLLRASQLAASSRTHNYKTLKEMLIAEFGQDIVDSLKQDLRRVFRESATAVETSSMRIESVLAAFLDEVDSPSRHAVLSMPTTEPSLRSEPSSLTLAVDKAKLVQSISPSGRVRVAWSKMNSAPSISQRTKQLEETRKTRERADSGSSSDSYGTIPLQNRVHIEKKKSLNKTFSANKQEKLLQSPDCRTVDADIVVIGSANFDQIVLVDAVPGVFETEIGRGYRSGVGGKGANQALMAAKLGASVKLVCKLGMDGHADHIVRKLDENNVNCSHVYHDPNLATGMALMMVDRSGHHGLILNPGANGGLSIEEIERARESIVASNCIVLSLEIPHGTVLGALNIACNSGKTVIMRPAPIFPDRKYNPALFSLPDCVIVTQGDFDKLSKLAGTSPINLTSASTATRSSQKRLRRMTTSETGPDSKAEDNAILRALATLIMTFSCRRMVLMRHGKAFFVSNDSKEENEVIIVPKTKRAIDFSGAAGCFVGSFAFFISKGETIRDSARHAAELSSELSINDMDEESDGEDAAGAEHNMLADFFTPVDQPIFQLCPANSPQMKAVSSLNAPSPFLSDPSPSSRVPAKKSRLYCGGRSPASQLRVPTPIAEENDEQENNDKDTDATDFELQGVKLFASQEDFPPLMNENAPSLANKKGGYNGNRFAVPAPRFPPATGMKQRREKRKRGTAKSFGNVGRRNGNSVNSVNSGLRLYRDFEGHKRIGTGGFSVCFRCRNILDEQIYAIKQYLRRFKTRSARNLALREVRTMASLGLNGHPHLVRYCGSWIDSNLLHIQTEFCDGGSLQSRYMNQSKVAEKNVKRTIGRSNSYYGAMSNTLKGFPKKDISHENTTEVVAKLNEVALIEILRQVGSALQYVHESGFVHLDVKPENILLCKTGRGELGGVCKLGDFGMSLPVRDDGSLIDEFASGIEEGDCRYLALEVLQEDYRCLWSADMFALGATVLELARITIGGNSLPESGPEWSELRAQNANLFDSENSPFSHEFESLIKLLMHVDPEARPSAKELLQHPLLLKKFRNNSNSVTDIQKNCNKKKKEKGPFDSDSDDDDDENHRFEMSQRHVMMSQKHLNELQELQLWKRKCKRLEIELKTEQMKRQGMDQTLF